MIALKVDYTSTIRASYTWLYLISEYFHILNRNTVTRYCKSTNVLLIGNWLFKNWLLFLKWEIIRYCISKIQTVVRVLSITCCFTKWTYALFFLLRNVYNEYAWNLLYVVKLIVRCWILKDHTLKCDESLESRVQIFDEWNVYLRHYNSSWVAWLRWNYYRPNKRTNKTKSA